MSPEAIMWLTAASTTVAVILGAVFAIGKLLLPLKKRLNFWITTWEQFMTDWAGEEARPGRDRVPGVMERLNNIDGELRNNGGSSVKDAVDRIEKRMIAGDKRFDKIEQRISKLEDKVTH